MNDINSNPNTLTQVAVETIAKICGDMLNEGIINLKVSAIFETLILSHHSLINTIESQQEKHREELRVLINSSNTKIWNLHDAVKEKDALIESQKEEIKRYNELFQEIGIMCAFEQSPQILRILSVLQKFQQEG